jgi:surface antigen
MISSALSFRGATLLAGVPLALSALTPAQAQFGGLLGSLGRSAGTSQQSTTSQGCPEGKKKGIGAAILGSMAGSVANRAAGRLSSFVPIPEVADMLTNAIACKLDAKEQKQAAEATLAATRGDAKVGQTSEWTSGSRENVAGKSTVTAVNQVDASGLQCITVTDVVIVNGEEARANKRMCKPKGGARYSLMA